MVSGLIRLAGRPAVPVDPAVLSWLGADALLVGTGTVVTSVDPGIVVWLGVDVFLTGGLLRADFTCTIIDPNDVCSVTDIDPDAVCTVTTPDEACAVV